MAKYTLYKIYHLSHLLVCSSVVLSVFALLNDRAPECFHVAKLKLYTHLTTPHLIPLLNHFPLVFPHGVLRKFYLVSAVANEPQGRRFCPYMVPTVEEQAGAVATETTKARDPEDRANSGPGIKGSLVAHLISPLQRPQLTRLCPRDCTHHQSPHLHSAGLPQ